MKKNTLVVLVALILVAVLAIPAMAVENEATPVARFGDTVGKATAATGDALGRLPIIGGACRATMALADYTLTGAAVVLGTVTAWGFNAATDGVKTTWTGAKALAIQVAHRHAPKEVVEAEAESRAAVDSINGYHGPEDRARLDALVASRLASN